MEEHLDMGKMASFFMKGDARGAMEYMKDIPEAKELLSPYVEIFEKENYISYPIPEELDALLLLYQKYFRDVFYLGESEDVASERLLANLARKLGVGKEESQIAGSLTQLFESQGFHVLTGKTNGHYGPYVWTTTEPTTFSVALPNGTREYTVNILDGFIFRSWMDYLTFGLKGTGGWTEPDGTICCIRKAYVFDSEAFKVSLLKHEAQHAEDLTRWPEITPMELEYRAKLVELIYSSDQGLLSKFLSHADENRLYDSHASASVLLKKKMGNLEKAEIPVIQERARELFAMSNQELIERLG